VKPIKLSIRKFSKKGAMCTLSLTLSSLALTCISKWDVVLEFEGDIGIYIMVMQTAGMQDYGDAKRWYAGLSWGVSG